MRLQFLLNEISTRMRAPLGVMLVAALAGSGCASIEGQQASIDMTDLQDASACPTDAAIAGWEKGEGGVRPPRDPAYRSQLIDKCVDAIDLKYGDFVRALRRESASVNLGSDLIAQGLSTGAALSGGEEAKMLSALSAGIAGIGATIDKNLYYKKTLPAIVAAMNANRTTILTRIRKSERDDPIGYTPSRARHDLREYALAGSIDTAITKVTEEASRAEDQSMDDLQNVFQATPIDAETSLKGQQFTDYIRDLVKKKEAGKLNAIAGVLGVPASKEVNKVGNAIREKFFQIMHGKDAAKAAEIMKELMTKLKAVLPDENFGASNG